MSTAGHDSQETIANYVGLSKRGCWDHIKELVDEGILVEGSGLQNVKTYRLP